ncbi:hypothetical protein JZ751_019568 [Albula glossodonta]|uniref:Uncharacterized protein n=1 Tax=Albula glossodonta TaxID=121402 RepID=A0A8T2MSB0_9TELE|nr:hypothetical protein JZ751_019568 [Albula glossodonta]
MESTSSPLNPSGTQMDTWTDTNLHRHHWVSLQRSDLIVRSGQKHKLKAVGWRPETLNVAKNPTKSQETDGQKSSKPQSANYCRLC